MLSNYLFLYCAQIFHFCLQQHHSYSSESQTFWSWDTLMVLKHTEDQDFHFVHMHPTCLYLPQWTTKLRNLKTDLINSLAINRPMRCRCSCDTFSWKITVFLKYSCQKNEFDHLERRQLLSPLWVSIQCIVSFYFFLAPCLVISWSFCKILLYAYFKKEGRKHNILEDLFFKSFWWQRFERTMEVPETTLWEPLPLRFTVLTTYNLKQ